MVGDDERETEKKEMRFGRCQKAKESRNIS